MAFDLKFVARVMAASEQTFLELGRSDRFDPPVMDQSVRNYRHKRQDPDLLIFLKGVRYMSMLNACGALFVNGFAQEMGVFYRCMDESMEDAVLFLRGLGPNESLNDLQRAVLAEFYQEEFVDPSVGMLKNNKRARVSRDKIRAAIASFPENEINPHDHGEMRGVLYNAWSGYVHGAYPHIMELYSAPPPTYHTRGMLNTPRMVEAAHQLVEYTHNSVLFLQYAAMKFERHDVLQRVMGIRSALDGRYPDLAKDPHTLLAALKRRRKAAGSVAAQAPRSAG